MAQPERRLREQLVATESLTTVCEGTLVEDASRSDLVIGVTERRLLGCAEDGESLDVRRKYVTTVRSRVETTSTYRGIDDRLVVRIGGAVAAISFVGLVLYAVVTAASVGLVLGLSIATVAGAYLAALARRRYDPDPSARPEVDLESASEFASTFEFDPTSDRQQAVAAGLCAGLLAAVSALLLVRAASGPLAPVLLLGTVGGLAIAEYGVRMENEFDGLEFDERSETVVEITTVDGHTVELRTDPAANLERELGRRALSGRRPPLETVRSETT